MVQLNHLVAFVWLLNSVKVFSSEDFKCDLKLLPIQKSLMYGNERIGNAEITYELYQWPKSRKGFVIVPYVISHVSGYCK
jgi:hypothetical protein